MDFIISPERRKPLKGHKFPRALKEKQETPANVRNSFVLSQAGRRSRKSTDIFKVLISLGASSGWSHGAAAAEWLLSLQTVLLTRSDLFCKGCSLGRDQGKAELMLPDILCLGDKTRQGGGEEKLGKPPGRKALPCWEGQCEGVGMSVVPKAQHPSPGLTGMLNAVVPRLWQGRAGRVAGVSLVFCWPGTSHKAEHDDEA